MKVGIQKTVEVEAKTLQIWIKVRDTFCARLVDQDNETICDYDGYVPGFMPGEHYGDYLSLDIDIESGQVTNWRTPSQEEIENLIKACEAA